MKVGTCPIRTDFSMPVKRILKGLRAPHWWDTPITPIKRTIKLGKTTLPQGGHTLNLYWHTDSGPSHRRKAFPNWSWTGWQGTKRVHNHILDTCIIRLMSINGKWQLVDYFSSKDAALFDDTGSPCLRITGPTFGLKPYIVDLACIDYRMPGYKTYYKGPYAVFPLSATVDIVASVRLGEGTTSEVLSDALALTIYEREYQI
ncbi:hypothetical protein BKA66DRAFT_591048 [Pyrenochaeta sp. MPI-SDFR-AT-0127]|nr:hypothetical protein BKA66DRAFT_591048 [Pyrenochaeta sp. MPI-SDFR-AT-0127]